MTSISWSIGQAVFFYPLAELLTGPGNSAAPAAGHHGRFLRRGTRAARAVSRNLSPSAKCKLVP
jgi:hypothetical protein